MKVLIDIDHSINKHETLDWIKEVLLETPGVKTVAIVGESCSNKYYVPENPSAEISPAIPCYERQDCTSCKNQYIIT